MLKQIKRLSVVSAFVATAAIGCVVGSKYGYGYEKSQELGI